MYLGDFTSDKQTFFKREEWVEGLFTWVKDVINDYGNKEISTCNTLCKTSLKNSYVRGQVFPFINIPIRHLDRELLGMYEYFGEQLDFSQQHIYCDFIVHGIYYAENKDAEQIASLEARARDYFKQKGYDIVQFYDGMATITIDREVLAEENGFKARLRSLLDDALNIQTEIY